MKHYWPSLLFNLGILALVACNGAPLAPTPQISEPNPRELELAARIGQADTGSFSFANIGEVGLTYTVSVPPEAPWLVVTAGAAGGLAAGETATVGLQATCPDTPAELETQVSIILNDLPETTRRVTVNLACTRPVPEMTDPTPDPLELSAQAGAVASGSLSFQNTGDANLDYNTAVTDEWLTITAGASGTASPGGTATVELEALCPDVAQELSTAITINSNDPVAPSRQVAVNLTCLAVVRINAGANEPVVTADGITWQADRSYVGGVPFSNPDLTVEDIEGTEDGVLYLTERNSGEETTAFGYNISLPNGSYTVSLHFAEIWFGAPGPAIDLTGPERRIFNVSLQGEVVLENYDMNALVEPTTALVECFEIEVTEGAMAVDLSGVVDRPKISAIEVLPAADFPCPPPTAASL